MSTKFARRSKQTVVPMATERDLHNRGALPRASAPITPQDAFGTLQGELQNGMKGTAPGNILKRARAAISGNADANVYSGSRGFGQSSEGTRKNVEAIGQFAPPLGGPNLTGNSVDIPNMRQGPTGLPIFDGLEIGDTSVYGPNVSMAGPMTDGLFQGMPSNPGPGYDYGLGGARSLPSENEMFKRDFEPSAAFPANPYQVIDSAFARTGPVEEDDVEAMPNAQSPYMWLVQSDYAGEMPTDQRARLIFSVKSIDETNPSTINHARLCNLAGINRLLMQMQTRADKFSQTRSAEAVIREVGLVGACLTDEHARTSQFGKRSSGDMRALNINTRGPCEISNYWGNVRLGQDVYLIVRGVPLNDIRAHRGAPPGTVNTDARSALAVQVADENTPSVVMQILPWADQTGMSEPTLRDRMYTDEHGVRRCGIVIRVGKVMQYFNTNVGDTSALATAFSQFGAKSAGQLRISINHAVIY